MSGTGFHFFDEALYLRRGELREDEMFFEGFSYFGFVCFAECSGFTVLDVVGEFYLLIVDE
jgi:hypothetical protein